VQVMETRKRILGQEHPDTLTSIHNLASTCFQLGRCQNAEELIVHVMETRKRISVFTGPGVDQSGLDRSGFSPVRSKDFSDWNRTSLKFHRTGPDSVWTGPGLHCRVRFILAEIELGMG
jgi:hypothetical protein